MTPPEVSEPTQRPRPGRELYVYYRAPEAQARPLQEAVGAMQSGLCATHPGLRARLLRRPLAEDGQHTWMEVYVLPPDADADVLAESIARSAHVLQHLTRGPRHVEHFIPCAS